MKNANETLMDYILNLTDEQASKLVECLDLLKQIAGMTTNQLVFTETFLEKMFGKETA